MKTAVVYATLSGHSKKLANAISEALGVHAYNIKKEQPKITDEECVIVVCGIYSGLIMPDLESFLKDFDFGNVKKAAIVMSSCSGDFSKVTVKSILSDRGIEIIDEF